MVQTLLGIVRPVGLTARVDTPSLHRIYYNFGLRIVIAGRAC